MSGNELARIGSIIDVDVDPRDDKIDGLERQVAKLRGELSDARHELARVREDSNRAMTGVRQQLSPLFRALQRLFGELDDAGVADVAPSVSASAASQPTPAANDRTAAIWDSWKARLPGGPAKIIDALMLQSDMNTQQLAIATGVHRNSIPAMIYKLNKAGLLNKNGGRFSLKQL